ncbi:hypothetical protein BCR41DRAFT_424727, partial [Lobosporangium transversale]
VPFDSASQFLANDPFLLLIILFIYYIHLHPYTLLHITLLSITLHCSRLLPLSYTTLLIQNKSRHLFERKQRINSQQCTPLFGNLASVLLLLWAL